MVIPVFLGKIIGGKLKVYQKEFMEIWIASIPEGSEVKVLISRAKKNRSNPQNNYLRGVVYPLISENTGYTNEEVHDAMKYKFLMTEDSPLVRVRSTASLSTIEFEAYLEQIKTWASSELGIVIPNPNDIVPDYLIN
jgi:hypothetical protein